MGLLLAIAGCIAVGALIAYAVVVTIRWLKNKVVEMIRRKNAKKVAVADLEKMIEECPNQQSLEQFLNDGYDMVIAGVDSSGKIDNVELVKDEGYGDPEVYNRLGNKGMVVISG